MYIHLGSDLQSWWLIWTGFQHHDTITGVSAVEAACKHQGCHCHSMIFVVQQCPVVVARLGHAKHAEPAEAEHHCGITIGNAGAPCCEAGAEMGITIQNHVVVLCRQQGGEWRELCDVAGERVEQVDSGALPLVDQNEESFRGEGEQLVVLELRDVDLDALAGGCVEEVAAVRRGEFLPEHGPPPGLNRRLRTPCARESTDNRLHERQTEWKRT